MFHQCIAHFNLTATGVQSCSWIHIVMYGICLPVLPVIRPILVGFIQPVSKLFLWWHRSKLWISFQYNDTHYELRELDRAQYMHLNVYNNCIAWSFLIDLLNCFGHLFSNYRHRSTYLQDECLRSHHFNLCISDLKAWMGFVSYLTINIFED